MQANWDSGTGSCVLLYLPHAAGCYANTTACVHSMMYMLCQACGMVCTCTFRLNCEVCAPFETHCPLWHVCHAAFAGSTQADAVCFVGKTRSCI
jgi:hypothetical protein